MKAKSLQDLGAIRKKVSDAAIAAAAAEEARKEAERRAEAERHLFTHAVGNVKPIAAQARVFITPQRPAARPLQQTLDDLLTNHAKGQYADPSVSVALAIGTITGYDPAKVLPHHLGPLHAGV